MNWIRQIFNRRRIYSDISAEFQEHLDEKIADLERAGMSRDDAVNAARREFGNMMSLEERSREVWQWPSIESLVSDLRYAVRQLRKSPAFTLAAALTLALNPSALLPSDSLVDCVPFYLQSMLKLSWKTASVPSALIVICRVSCTR